MMTSFRDTAPRVAGQGLAQRSRAHSSVAVPHCHERLPRRAEAAAAAPARLGCFAAVGGREPTIFRVDEPVWLEPMPDAWLAGAEPSDPHARYALKESVALAFVAVLQSIVRHPRARRIPWRQSNS